MSIDPAPRGPRPWEPSTLESDTVGLTSGSSALCRAIFKSDTISLSKSRLIRASL